MFTTSKNERSKGKTNVILNNKNYEYELNLIVEVIRQSSQIK